MKNVAKYSAKYWEIMTKMLLSAAEIRSVKIGAKFA